MLTLSVPLPQVADGSRQILRVKAKERHIFLFDLYLVVCKEVKDSNGKAKYLYKSKMMKSEMGVTEHMEGDECKFAIWTGRTPMSENKTVLKVEAAHDLNSHGHF